MIQQLNKPLLLLWRALVSTLSSSSLETAAVFALLLPLTPVMLLWVVIQPLTLQTDNKLCIQLILSHCQNKGLK